MAGGRALTALQLPLVSFKGFVYVAVQPVGSTPGPEGGSGMASFKLTLPPASLFESRKRLVA